MKRFLLLTASTVGLLCVAGTGVQASPTTTSPQWNYNFSSIPTTSNPNPWSYTTVGNNGSLNITGAQNVSATGTSNVTLASLQLSSTAPTPDSAVLSNNNWSGILSVQDGASHTSASLALSGMFTGPGMANGVSTPSTFSANNANVYFNPSQLNIKPGAGWTSIMGSNGQVADYMWKASSGNTYTIPVADLSFTPPGIPQTTTALSPTQLNGAIAANVEVNAGTPTGGTGTGGTGTGGTGTGGTGTGGTASTPEPSSLVLSCFGLGFAGLVSWRRRRSLAAQLA